MHDDHDIDETADDEAGEFDNMTEAEFEGFLTEAIDAHADDSDAPRADISTFAEAGLLTMNHGLVVRIGEAEFQVTIVRSR